MNAFEFVVQVLEFQYFPNEEVSVSVGNLGVSDVDHIVVNEEVQL